MLSKKALLALFDFRDCILLAQEFTQGFSYETFKESRLHFFAVTRALEIISEASRRVARLASRNGIRLTVAQHQGRRKYVPARLRQCGRIHRLEDRA